MCQNDSTMNDGRYRQHLRTYYRLISESQAAFQHVTTLAFRSHCRSFKSSVLQKRWVSTHSGMQRRRRSRRLFSWPRSWKALTRDFRQFMVSEISESFMKIFMNFSIFTGFSRTSPTEKVHRCPHQEHVHARCFLMVNVKDVKLVNNFSTQCRMYRCGGMWLKRRVSLHILHIMKLYSDYTVTNTVTIQNGFLLWMSNVW